MSNSILPKYLTTKLPPENEIDVESQKGLRNFPSTKKSFWIRPVRLYLSTVYLYEVIGKLPMPISTTEKEEERL